MRFLPALETWSSGAQWVAAAGVVAYAGVAVSVYATRARRAPPSPPPNKGQQSPGPDRWPTPDKEKSELVEAALNLLNDQARLSACLLLDLLPVTLDATRPASGRGLHEMSGPLAQAQALRAVLLAAIERLKPANLNPLASSPALRQYRVLSDRYVLERPVAHTVTSLNISERTYHRARKEAITAVARDLHAREQQTARRTPALTQHSARDAIRRS
jgi:hypothetical protein